MKRTLVLKRETLAALTTDELAGIHGGAPIPTILGVCDWTEPSSPLNCPTRYDTCICPN